MIISCLTTDPVKGCSYSDMEDVIKNIPVIIDTDPGVDDLLALKIAFSCPSLDIRLVSSVAGNVPIELTTANALYITKKYGGDIPVAKGGMSPLYGTLSDASAVHGKSGIGNYTIPGHSYKIDKRTASDAMYDVIKRSDTPVAVIALGPLTNIASLITDHPDAVENISVISSMAGSPSGAGNITEYSEFNVYCDPDALDTVLRSGADVILSPMEIGYDTKLPVEDILCRVKGTEFGDMLSSVLDGYHDDGAGEGYVAMYDANAVLALIRPDLYRYIRCEATVDVTHHPGQTFFVPDDDGRQLWAVADNIRGIAEAMLGGLS